MPAAEEHAAGQFDTGYDNGYTRVMKTAISIPDDVFQSADDLARRLGISRSELYVRALKTYLEGHREDRVTQRLDEVYSEVDSRLDPMLQELQIRSIPSGDW